MRFFLRFSQKNSAIGYKNRAAARGQPLSSFSVFLDSIVHPSVYFIQTFLPFTITMPL